MRPAVIVSNFLQGEDIIVAFISSLKHRTQKTDIVLNSHDKDFSKTGLKIDSVIKTGKLATLDKKIILGEIGEVSMDIEKEINKKSKYCLDYNFLPLHLPPHFPFGVPLFYFFLFHVFSCLGRGRFRL